jgi:hypothetical protein
VIARARPGPVWLLDWLLFGCGGDDYHAVRDLHSSGETIIGFSDSLTEGIGADCGEN